MPSQTSSFSQSPRASQAGFSRGNSLGKNLLVSEMELNTLVEVTACHKGPKSGDEVSLRLLPFPSLLPAPQYSLLQPPSK